MCVPRRIHRIRGIFCIMSFSRGGMFFKEYKPSCPRRCISSYWIWLCFTTTCIPWNTFTRCQAKWIRSAEGLEHLTVNAKLATVLDSIPASSGTDEGRKMKLCWIKYSKNHKSPSMTSPYTFRKWASPNIIQCSPLQFLPCPDDACTSRRTPPIAGTWSTQSSCRLLNENPVYLWKLSQIPDELGDQSRSGELKWFIATWLISPFPPFHSWRTMRVGLADLVKFPPVAATQGECLMEQY